MINGVKIKPLKQISDDRGKVMHMLRNDSKGFKGFGEIYFSYIYPGAIKGWYIHKKMTLNYAVLWGNIKLVLYDSRLKSNTYGESQEIFTGVDNYCLITIPPLIWSGFTCIGNDSAIVANCSSIPHDDKEIERLDPSNPKIPYSWDNPG